MTAWQSELMRQDVDAIWEAEAAEQWERLNAHDPREKELKEAALDMRLAMREISDGEDYLYDAVAKLSGTPMADKVQSLVEEVLDLHGQIENLAMVYGKGRRE